MAHKKLTSKGVVVPSIKTVRERQRKRKEAKQKREAERRDTDLQKERGSQVQRNRSFNKIMNSVRKLEKKRKK